MEIWDILIGIVFFALIFGVGFIIHDGTSQLSEFCEDRGYKYGGSFSHECYKTIGGFLEIKEVVIYDGEVYWRSD